MATRAMAAKKHHKDKKIPWSERVVAWIGQQIVRGCSDMGVVHRDIKPDNILVDDAEENGFFTGDTTAGARVMIADLDIVARTGLVDERGAHLPRVTAKGQVVGTLAFMPLEALISSEVDWRADQHAVGVSILACANRGQLPEQLDMICSVQEATLVLTGGLDLSPLASMPALRAVVAKMTAPNPAHRYQSWEAVDAALAKISGARVP